jgi:acyl carrier protein
MAIAISPRLKQVILRELGLGDFDLQPSMTASKVPGWDSLRHVQIIAAVEKEYGVHFRTLEVIRVRNLGQLQDLIDRKCAAGGGPPP